LLKNVSELSEPTHF